MKNFPKRKGSALADYIMITVFFAMALAAISFQMNPQLLIRYFSNSTGGDTTVGGDTITLPVMGE